jgi:hypothetical protein
MARKGCFLSIMFALNLLVITEHFLISMNFVMVYQLNDVANVCGNVQLSPFN